MRVEYEVLEDSGYKPATIYIYYILRCPRFAYVTAPISMNKISDMFQQILKEKCSEEISEYFLSMFF